MAVAPIAPNFDQTPFPNWAGGGVKVVADEIDRSFFLDPACQIFSRENSMPHLLFLALASVLGMGLALPASASPLAYTAIDLGTLGGGGSAALGLNNLGQVTGSSQIAAGSFHAFITGRNGLGMIDLGTLGGSGSTGTGINRAGQVTGESGTATDAFHAFITGRNGLGMTDLGTLGGSASTGFGINNAGQVTGSSETAAGSFHAFITGRNGLGMIDLGTLGGSASTGFGINNAGQVTGYSETAAGSFHAFITGSNGLGMTDLGTLGGLFSRGLGINDAGQVTGSSQTADGSSHAFITGRNGLGMTDLNALVDLPGDAYFGVASGINDMGQIIANASDSHAYLLSPVAAHVFQASSDPPIPAIPEPETNVLLMTGLGLVGFMARRRRDRQPAPCLGN